MKEKNNTIIKELILWLFPFYLIIIMELIFKIVNGGIEYVFYTNTGVLMFSVFIGYLLYGLLLAILKKTSKTNVIFTIIIFFILIINQIKIIYTNEPLYFKDINFITKIPELSKILINTKMQIPIYFFMILLIFIIILFCIYIFSKKNEIKIDNKKTRIILSGICLIILIILFIPNKHIKNINLKLIFNTDNYQDYNSYTTDFNYYMCNTLISGMYGTYLNDIFTEPEDYDEERLENELNEVDENAEKTMGDMPNIIVVFSEAFWDIEKTQEIKFDKKLTSNMENILRDGKKIDLLTCSYGGMSENVAFELLTGSSMKYFNKGYIPIMSLYNRKNSDKIPSIIKILKENNYESKVIFGKDYYNSKNAFQKIGFDEYIELEETEQNVKGNYISDEYMIDYLINCLENKSKNKKAFYTIETIQNHMPYTIEKYEKYDIKVEESKFEEDDEETLLSYAQGIYDADKQLNKLYEYVENMEEPTLLIFMGDHLPYLYTNNGKNLIDKFEYFSNSNQLVNMFNKYNTEAIITANYSIDYEKVPELLSTDLLFTYIINNININIPNYYKWLYQNINIMPASNRYITLDENKNIYATNELTGKLLDLYKLRENMQYKIVIKNDFE